MGKKKKKKKKKRYENLARAYKAHQKNYRERYDGCSIAPVDTRYVNPEYEVQFSLSSDEFVIGSHDGRIMITIRSKYTKKHVKEAAAALKALADLGTPYYQEDQDIFRKENEENIRRDLNLPKQPKGLCDNAEISEDEVQP